MNKKIITTISLLILVILGFVLLKDRNEQQVDLDNITIGAIAPLSGQISVLGERMRGGMEIARADLISEGLAKSIKVIYEDACDTKSSLNATRKLIDQDQVKIIGSSFCLFGEDAVIPITESKKVIFFNTAANPESVLNKNYVFSTNFAIRDDSYKLAEFATSKLKAKTAAIIHLDTSFGESYRMNFKKRFEELGGQVVLTEARLPDASDFRTELTKIKALKPDVLLIVHFGSSLGNSIKQARELGITAKILGDYESEDPTVLKFADVAAEGFIISSSQPEIKTAAVRNFEQKYFAKYGEFPDVLASNAYDALQLQIRSYVKCAGETDCITNELHKVKNYDGVSGNITINKDNSVTKYTIFKIVKNGQFVDYTD